jgi:outer membrane lipoprotein-sorting protein
MPVSLKLVVLGVIVSAPVGVRAQPLADVLESMITAYGGEENVRKLDHMVQEWDLLALTRNKQGTDKRSIQLPRQLKVELTYPDKQETRVLDGDTGYAVFDDREPAIASNMQRSAMQLQLMRFYSPLTLRERIDSLELSRSDEYLTLTLRESGLQADYIVDAETWFIVKVVGTLAFNGTRMQFTTEYAEFAKVDGVVIHHRENKFVGATNTAVLRLRNVELGVDFGDDEFLPRRNETDPLVAGLAHPATPDTK